jgi:hypothetical protein
LPHTTKPLLRGSAPIAAIALLAIAGVAAAIVVSVPNELQMPGTQPLEIPPIDSSLSCSSCHGNYNPAIEPYQIWSGSMMAHAGRDPLTWGALAVAERDFPGAGDTCLRCHTALGWYDGRSEPTDGSALVADDFDGVSCAVCHSLTNPDNSELLGVMNAPYIANDGGNPAQAYRGSGQASIWGGYEKLGPYSNPATPHQWLQSQFHRRSDLCGTCHDLSNPLTGDLAPNNGAMTPLAPGTFDGTLGGPLANKAAFNNFPHAYGVDQRTFSEHKSSPFSTMPVSDFRKLPAVMKQGKLRMAYEAAITSNPSNGGNYLDGVQRNFTCQSCHMPPVNGKGCALFGVPQRADLPLHDLTGGNYWTPDAIVYLEAQNRLVGGNGLDYAQQQGLQEGKLRAKENLRDAAALVVTANDVTVFNLTGHKLTSGYAEGRRMWLNVKWFNSSDVLIREDGHYGKLSVVLHGHATDVETILDAASPYTRIYQARYGISQDWAAKLIALGRPANLPIEFDHVSGAASLTLGQLAAQSPGSSAHTFHLALNNTLLSDNRIPPYEMDRDSAFERNAQPVPATQYGNPASGGYYDNWDKFALTPPAGAARARIRLMYQPTSWEYIQFLMLANDGSVPFLASVGDDVLEAWQQTGMATPYVMCEANWGSSAPVVYCTAKTNSAGCVPAIGSTGVPSATSGRDFFVTCANVLNDRTGFLRYGVNGPNAAPFQGGYNCVANPAQRYGTQNSGGTLLPASDCTGGYALDFNALIASGANPSLVANATVWAQWFSRDGSSAQPYGLSDALKFTIEP